MTQKKVTGNQLDPTDIEGPLVCATDTDTLSAGKAQIYLSADAANDDIQIGSLNPAIALLSVWNSGGGAPMAMGCEKVLTPAGELLAFTYHSQTFNLAQVQTWQSIALPSPANSVVVCSARVASSAPPTSMLILARKDASETVNQTLVAHNNNPGNPGVIYGAFTIQSDASGDIDILVQAVGGTVGTNPWLRLHGWFSSD